MRSAYNETTILFPESLLQPKLYLLGSDVATVLVAVRYAILWPFHVSYKVGPYVCVHGWEEDGGRGWARDC
jgi:hypothetical protein